ncbi:MAG TPA: DUF1318 domain-containing protein [Acidiferrobacteraceae bacterium]|nr:DUF1318 domain-containing protein [Acidiferrobacteraceae bacterium]
MFKKDSFSLPRHVAQVIFLAGMLCVTSLFAAELQQTKVQGDVGEMPNGYLGLVKPDAPDAVKAMVAEINAKRRVSYQSIAQRHGTSLQSVETQAGRKAMDMTPPGQYIKNLSGNWVKK